MPPVSLFNVNQRLETDLTFRGKMFQRAGPGQKRLFPLISLVEIPGVTDLNEGLFCETSTVDQSHWNKSSDKPGSMPWRL